MSRKSLLLATIVLAVPAFSQSAWSWGGDGHRIVGAVADQVLASHPTAKAKVSALLNGRSLSEVSVFADCAKGFMYCHRAPSAEEQAFVRKNPDHHAYHYADIPIQQPKYIAGTAGTARDDVVQVIRYAVQTLRGTAPTDGPADLQPEEAVWVLAHLVGDIHQPLHVGTIYYDHDCGNIVDPNAPTNWALWRSYPLRVGERRTPPVGDRQPDQLDRPLRRADSHGPRRRLSEPIVYKPGQCLVLEAMSQ